MTNTHPHYLYSDIVNSIKATKATITAMTGLLDGTVAYAIDTNEFGTYDIDSNSWTWLGASALLYVQDEGIPIGSPGTLNFIGAGVTATISGSVVQISVPSSGGGGSFDNFWNSGTAGINSIRAKTTGTTNAVGNLSFAIGLNTYASGSYSVAEGALTTARNVAAHAEGNSTIAGGASSHAEGFSTLATADNSHAEGGGTVAYGTASHAEGNGSIASGTYSFAGGDNNHAIGQASAALGGQYNRVAGNNSVVLGGSGTMVTANDTVFVPNLNIRYIQTGTPILNLGADASGNVVIGTTGSSGVGGTSPHPPEGRLTLLTGTAVPTTDLTNQTTIYYVPFRGDLYPSYNGTTWSERTFVPLMLSLDPNTGHAGFHASGTNFDLFVVNDAGVDRLCSGPTWTGTTTRNNLLEFKNGILTNAATISVRYGTGTTDTLNIPKNQATVVGTFRSTGAGQATDTAQNRLLSNLYNQVRRKIKVIDTTDSWVTTGGTALRSWNNNTANRFGFVICWDIETVDLEFFGLHSVSSGGTANVGIGLDSITANSADAVYPASNSSATILTVAMAKYSGYPGVGFHFLQLLELAGASNTTFYGDIGNGALYQSGAVGFISG